MLLPYRRGRGRATTELIASAGMASIGNRAGLQSFGCRSAIGARRTPNRLMFGLPPSGADPAMQTAPRQFQASKLRAPRL